MNQDLIEIRFKSFLVMLSVKPGKDIMKLSNKNFTVLHGTGKNKAILTEAEDFDQLASALSVYRKLSYSNITVYHPKEKGIRNPKGKLLAFDC